MKVSRLAHTPRMAQLLIGYARCGSAPEDQVAEREALAAAGIGQGRIYTDVGLRGTTRPRPGLAQAMAACRAGDTLVVVSLDRLARSVPDAAEIVADLAGRGVVLQVGGCCFGPGDPLCPVLAMVAEFQRALVRGRTTEGMRMARVAGRLKGRPPKLSAVAEAHVVQLFDAGEHTTAEIAELLAVSRSTVYRAVHRAERAKRTRPA